MFSFSDYLIMPAIVIAAVALNFILGEPRRYHPLVGFGWIADKFEARFNPAIDQDKSKQRLIGTCALALLLTPFMLLAYRLAQRSGWRSICGCDT
ncbi:MAG: cobalamin biosynthesis protein [Pseudomonadota bacterium]